MNNKESDEVTRSIQEGEKLEDKGSNPVLLSHSNEDKNKPEMDNKKERKTFWDFDWSCC